MAQHGGGELSLVLGLLMTAACAAAPDQASGRSLSERPSKFTASGRLKIDAPAAVSMRNDGSCVATGELSTYREGETLVLVRDPGGREVAKAELGPGVPDAYTEQGEQIVVPGTCLFPFEIKGLKEQSGVFTAELEGMLKRSFFTSKSRYITFVIEE